MLEVLITSNKAKGASLINICLPIFDDFLGVLVDFTIYNITDSPCSP